MSCQCWAWRQHRCSDDAARPGLGISAWKYLLPLYWARASTACLESLLCSQASPSNAPLPLYPSHPPGLTALLFQHSSLLPCPASCLPQKPLYLQSLLRLFLYSPSSPQVLLSIYTLFCPPQLAAPSAAPCSAHSKAAITPSREAQSPCSEMPPADTLLSPRCRPVVSHHHKRQPASPPQGQHWGTGDQDHQNVRGFYHFNFSLLNLPCLQRLRVVL